MWGEACQTPYLREIVKLEDLVIWIISPEHWGEQLVSKHHYALELAKRGNDVLFIEPAGGNEIQPTTAADNLQVMSWKPLRGMRKLPRSIARQLQKREYHRIAAQTGALPDLIWSFDNSRFFDLNVLGTEVKSIHHLVDLNQDFELARACSSADWCFTTTRFIREQALKYNQKAYNIGHGCDIFEVEEWKEAHPRTRIVYSGNLLIDLLDRERILKAVDRFHFADFYFVGSYEPNNFTTKASGQAINFIEALRTRNNVKLLGPLKGEAYQNTLSAADLFIVAYRSEYYEQVANPHKIPELLCTGRAIISNVLDSYRDLNLFEMADDDDTWFALLEVAIKDPSSFNAPDLQLARKQWAWQHSYVQQVNHIEEMMS